MVRLPEIEDQDGVESLVRLFDDIAVHYTVTRHDDCGLQESGRIYQCKTRLEQGRDKIRGAEFCLQNFVDSNFFPAKVHFSFS